MKRIIIVLFILSVSWACNNSHENAELRQDSSESMSTSNNGHVISGKIEKINVSLISDYGNYLFIRIKTVPTDALISYENAHRYELIESPNLEIKSFKELMSYKKYLEKWKDKEVTLSCSPEKLKGKSYYIVNSLKWVN